MSKISVTTIAGLTSGGDANTVKIESGDDFVVDTNVLKVDASNDRVGIGTASPTQATLHVAGGGVPARFESTSSATTYVQFGASGTSNYGQIAMNGNDMTLRTAYTDRMKIDGSGNIMAPAITLGNGTTYAAENTLDDYEEGTFTPTLTPGSGSYNGLTLTGYYRKIGSIVHVMMNLHITASGNAGGSATVGNLPFTAANLESGFRATSKMRENAATGVCGQFNVNNAATNGFLQNDDGTNIAHITGRKYMINATYFSA